jgi:hypothetical protein
MRRVAAFILALAAFTGAPAHAAGDNGSQRFVSGVPLQQVEGIATYGPFRVTDATHAALVGITDEASPREFAQMLHDYPELAELDLVECPGTLDDWANLALGRMIHWAGIETHVPADGSVRSGAVDLLVAGARRSIDDGATFAVHEWADDEGKQAADFAPDAPENAKYLDYYREMGMSADEAASFYAMTNSVPNDEARWLTATEMRAWVQTDASAVPQPRLAYLDLSQLLP